ncbi:hypothetical protein BGX23_008357 [Mortierella sp. AD031]|nr:hypothetical protein BGX23_008357 [Mortierella sp. AD031]
MYLFEQQHVLRLARQVHGGDVGIAANKADSEYAGRKMAALDDWLTHRLEQDKYQSYKLDPEVPKKPTKSVWPMLDKFDMGHKLLEFAAEKVYWAMDKKKNEIKRERLKMFDKSKGQIREIVDLLEHDLGSDWHSKVTQQAKNLAQSRLF